MNKRWALLAFLVAACDTGFTEAYEVDEPKIMGTRIEVVGAPERATPRVGEEFAMHVLVARSTHESTLPLNKQLDASVSVCVGGQAPGGSLFCVAEIDLSALQGSRRNTVKSFEEILIPLSFGMIDPRAIAQTTDVLLFGAVCVEGKVERVKGKVAGTDPVSQLYRCTKNDSAELKDALTFTDIITIDYEDDVFEANANPSFSCDPADEESICNAGSTHDDEETRAGSIVLVRPKDDENEQAKRVAVEWPEVFEAPVEPLAYTGCASDDRFEALKVEVGSGEHTIRMRFDGVERETYKVAEERYNKVSIVDKREELLIAQSATKDFGALGRYFSFVPRDADDANSEAEIDFTPPSEGSSQAKSVTEAGSLVRFYFVVRDQRGGVDFATRSLCLVPAPAKDP